MAGLFTHKQLQSTSHVAGKIASCAACGLYSSVESPRMKPYGNFKREIMNIGEAPGEAEDASGMPWQGKTGHLLKRMYKKVGIDLFEDCINLNAVNCRPTDKEGYNRPPTNNEILNCRTRVLKAIDKYKPSVIVLLGTSAIASVIGNHWKKDLGSVSKWRGFCIPEQDYNAWVCPVFHPSYVERGEREIETIYLQDFQRIAEVIDKPLLKYRVPKIEVIEDLSVLYDVPDLVAFDYETTGIKPHEKGHRIICASVATSEDHAYTFMMPNTKKERQPFIDMLANSQISKMAHNMKFEITWSRVRLRTEVNNMLWDSMLAAHILDNRTGITGLKFQTYVNFGIGDYDSDVSPYLQSNDSKNGNALNRIEELIQIPESKEKLLRYCALDSIYQYRLAVLQQQIMDYSYLPF